MKRILFAALLFITAQIGSAQTQIEGLLLSTFGDTIIGANVVLRGTYDGTSTDLKGRFAFNSSEKGAQVLQVTYIGFDTLNIPVQLNGQAIKLNLKIRANVNQLSETVILAGTFEAGDSKKTVVLKPVDIALTAGAVADITGALLTLPGAVRNQESGQLLVRGGSPSETRTLIDGMYVQSPYNNTTGNMPARNRFSPFMFKGMSFSSGGYSAEYGQALSSTLQLNSSDLSGKNVTGLQIMSVGAGATQQKSWKKSELNLGGMYTNLKPYFGLVRQNFHWRQAPVSSNAEVSFKTKTSQTGLFKIYATAAQNSFDLDAPQDGDDRKMAPLQLKGDNLYLNTSFKEIVGKTWALFVGAAYSNNRDRIQQNFNLQRVQQSFQSRFTLTREMSERVKLKFGAEQLWSEFDETFVQGERFHTLRRDQNLAAFAETDLTLSKKWLLRAGLRSERSSMLQKAALAPRFSTAILLGKGEQLTFSAGRFFQNPDFTLLRRGTYVDFEQADHFILGYQKQVKGYLFRSELYQKNYRSLVKTNAELLNNLGGGYARGLDLFWRDTKTIKNGDYYLSYSYLDTKREQQDAPGLVMPTFAAKHNLSLVYKHWMPKVQSILSASYAFQSGRPYNDPNSKGFNTGRTQAFHDLSLTWAYLTNIRNNFTVVYLAANNVPGFKQVSGYRFAQRPEANGRYYGSPILPPAKRFVFLGLIVTIGEKFTKNQDNNDDF
jgi:vitamin B12 transporter